MWEDLEGGKGKGKGGNYNGKKNLKNTNIFSCIAHKRQLVQFMSNVNLG